MVLFFLKTSFLDVGKESPHQSVMGYGEVIISHIPETGIVKNKMHKSCSQGQAW